MVKNLFFISDSITVTEDEQTKEVPAFFASQGQIRAGLKGKPNPPQVGILAGKTIYHLATQDEGLVTELKASPDFLGESLLEMALTNPDAARQVVRVEVPTEEADPETGEVRQVVKRMTYQAWLDAGKPAKRGGEHAHRFSGVALPDDDETTLIESLGG